MIIIYCVYLCLPAAVKVSHRTKQVSLSAGARIIAGTMAGLVGALIRLGEASQPRAPTWCSCCLGCASLLLPPVRVHLSHASNPRGVEVLLRSKTPSSLTRHTGLPAAATGG